MLLERRVHAGILDGSITVIFRRWKRPLVVAGRRYRTSVGLLLVDAADVVKPSRISRADANAAGYHTVTAAVADLRGDPTDPVYRLRVRRVDGPDPRDVLAADAALDDADRAEIARRLDRLDRASPHGPWTAAVLTAIADHPATRAADLADSFGREMLPFKTDVRKLKNLGLTVSLDKGYRLSARGAAYLDRPLPPEVAELRPLSPGPRRGRG
jgi:hypothetical protein